MREPSGLDRLVRDADRVARSTYQRALGAGFADTPEQRTLAAVGLEHGWLRGYLLYLDAEPIAYWLCSVYGGTILIRTAGYDNAYAEQRVGIYLLMRVVEDACADPALRVLDFGPGDAAYKQQFSNEQWQERNLVVFAPSFRGRRINLTRTGIVAPVRSSAACSTRPADRPRTGALARSAPARLTASYGSPADATVGGHSPVNVPKAVRRAPKIVRNFVRDMRYGRPLGGTVKTRYAHLGARDVGNADYDDLAIIFARLEVTAEDVIVDVGCGKGRSTNWFLSRYPDTTIYAIELDPEICASTAKRLRRHGRVKMLCGDATELLPAEGTVFYLFNPFDESVMRRFITALTALKEGARAARRRSSTTTTSTSSCT